MLRTLIFPVVGLWFALGFADPAHAELALERIKRTGVLTAGVRTDAVPFGYLDSDNRIQGYSVDLIKLVQRQLEQELNRPIQLKLAVVTLEDRFQQVQDSKVDLVCEVTSITPERERAVDFSIPFFTSGIQLLVRQEDALRLDPTQISEEELQQARPSQVAIGFLQGTTTDTEFRAVYPRANWQALTSRAEGVDRLKERTLDAIASDGILLLGALWQEKTPFDQFRLVPEEPLSFENYGCILPQGDRPWSEVVNQVITSAENIQLWQQWFDQETGQFPYERFNSSLNSPK
ncbi:MAG: amino acid ABC transporter substrate-binding protein [Microcoleaceae cyanobacterium]